MAMSGCGDVSGAASSPDGGAGGLADRVFTAESVTEGGAERPPVEGTAITVGFRDGQIHADAGCNQMTGTATIGADRIEVAELMSTEMGCDPARHEQDEWLAGVLTANPAYTLDGDRLRLETDTTVIELREQAAPADQPLEGTVWVLDTIITGETASSVPVGAQLVFGEGGVTTRIENCNQGSADTEISDGTIRFGALVSTRMACAEPAAGVERAITAVLDGGEVAYTVEGDSLTLEHPDGTALRLRAGGGIAPSDQPGQTPTPEPSVPTTF
ncbi:META domain-containing protein [Allonocardiopsis opalescens]|uniref:META domain-containing protein n=1 Tax=Allonocardiopsis opalescens TaxID=1144618 RepID=UPI00147356B4|nr:META domain-containing protein [Allonocardiopsis opalescens]